MAPQPKRKHSKRRGRVRASAHLLGLLKLVSCKACGKLIKSHRVCPFCGFYDGKSFLSKPSP